MSVFEAFYDLNPIGVIDQNKWDERSPEINYAFRRQAVYTPLVRWEAQGPAQNEYEFEMIPGDVDTDDISFTANYVGDPYGIDSRMRKWSVKRYGDKVQLHKSMNVFNQWKLSPGNRDWRPLLRSVLGDNIVRKHELLSRNVFLSGPKKFWTYGGNATSFGDIGSDDTFGLSLVNAWNLRLGQTGNPIVPGDMANAKVAMISPGAKYDFFQALPGASANEAQLFRDVSIYGDQTRILRGEFGTFKNIRFIEVPNDEFGMNMNVLYNCGPITKQYGVTAAIKIGDGAPDPETTAIDDVWFTGQKDVTHYIQLENFADGEFVEGDIITIHVKRTSAYGVTSGVDPLDGKLINRRVVSVDHTNNRLSLDRPIMRNYTSGFIGKSVTGNVDATLYAYVTKGKHVGMSLVLGSREGVRGKVVQQTQFYNPMPVDDFESIWRFSWDAILGWNVADPHMFEVHFHAVSLPKPGGIIAP